MANASRFALSVSIVLLASLATGCGSNPAPETSAVPPIATPTQVATPTPIATPAAPLIAGIDRVDLVTQRQIQQYLSQLVGQGFGLNRQGVWMQTGTELLANHQGTVPLPAASLTKVATSLATLQTLGAEYQFVTLIGRTGPVANGILQGDLVIQGSGDPLFVWEEAIALGNTLNRLGIRQVTGKLIVLDKFYMNYEQNPQKSGELLKQGMNAALWSAEAAAQFQTLPAGTPRPQVMIQGPVQVATAAPAQIQLSVRHHSLPLAELLKKMNQYSNNPMAEILAESIGGAKVVEQKVIEATGTPAAEIRLINGSGLGEDNRMSPRTVCAMFRAIERLLQPVKMTVGDVFTIVGQDEGILHERKIPALSVVKSGSLNAVSTLAGALPTQQQGTVWFVIMNGGDNLEGFRADQEALLRTFSNQWGAAPRLPPELSPNPDRRTKTSRDEIVS
jgi:serine-type D-Ala-D-Ala carboxypeptidase/endopeptidase (penicillin-binding protein 4)